MLHPLFLRRSLERYLKHPDFRSTVAMPIVADDSYLFSSAGGLTLILK